MSRVKWLCCTLGSLSRELFDLQVIALLISPIESMSTVVGLRGFGHVASTGTDILHSDIIGKCTKSMVYDDQEFSSAQLAPRARLDLCFWSGESSRVWLRSHGASAVQASFGHLPYRPESMLRRVVPALVSGGGSCTGRARQARHLDSGSARSACGPDVLQWRLGRTTAGTEQHSSNS